MDKFLAGGQLASTVENGDENAIEFSEYLEGQDYDAP